jgi:nitronate monooxygenase
VHEFLAFERPILQAPMAGVQGSALALAVSNAGGLGALPCAMLAPDALRAELDVLRAGTTRPFNLNFFCHTAPVPDPAREQAWRVALAPYYREAGLDRSARAPPVERASFDGRIAAIVAPYRPAFVSFHFGLPDAELLAEVHSWGSKILASATTVDEARWLEARGVDAIIAQGLEAGGHRGHFLARDVARESDLSTLLPQVVRAVRVPVVAAGGIANARGVADALALGAVAAQVGTAWLLCPEATTRPVHRACLQDGSALDTELTNLFSGGLARGIVNRLMRELGPISPLVPAFPLAADALAPLREHAERNGSGDFSPLWAGRNARHCREMPAQALLRALAGDG